MYWDRNASKLVEPLNAASPILVTLSGIVTFVSLSVKMHFTSTLFSTVNLAIDLLDNYL